MLALAGQDAESAHARRLVAALEQPLHADADAEERCAPRTASAIASRHGPSRTAVAAKLPTPGTINAAAFAHSAGPRGVSNSAPSVVGALRTDVRLPAP